MDLLAIKKRLNVGPNPQGTSDRGRNLPYLLSQDELQWKETTVPIQWSVDSEIPPTHVCDITQKPIGTHDRYHGTVSTWKDLVDNRQLIQTSRRNQSIHGAAKVHQGGWD